MPFRHARRQDASRLPIVGGLAAWFQRIARARAGRVPIGLIALLPIALAIDAFDAADELFLGPVGMGAAFVVESAFLIAVTGGMAPAFAFAALDLVPLVDTIPWATILLGREIWRAWRDGPRDDTPRSAGTVIDV